MIIVIIITMSCNAIALISWQMSLKGVFSLAGFRVTQCLLFISSPMVIRDAVYTMTI